MILAIRYIAVICPVRMLILLLLLVLQGLLPTLNVHATGTIVQSIETSDAQSHQLLLPVLLWCVSLLGIQCLEPLVQLVQGDVNETVTRFFNEAILHKVNSAQNIALFDDKNRYEQLELLRKEAAYTPHNFIITTIYLFRAIVVVVGLLTVLIGQAGFGPAVCAVSVLPLLLINVKVQKAYWHSLMKSARDAILMRYVYDISMNKSNLQEIRVYGLGPWLNEKYRKAADATSKRMHRQRVNALIKPVPVMVLSATIMGTGVYLFLHTLTSTQMTTAAIVMAFQSVIMMKSYLDEAAIYSGHIVSMGEFFKTYRNFMQGDADSLQSSKQVIPASDPYTITFDNLSFHYPGQTQPVLKNLSFSIPAGQKVAILGENGSGKTTLIKLLMGMYPVGQNSLRISGVSLSDADLIDYRTKVATVFQDFGRYEFTVAENIAFAAVSGGKSSAEITSLLKKVQFPYEEQVELGKRFGGSELSGGQWQKLAIARALYRKANLFIFDEFSSSLDPEIEYQLFNEILSLDATLIAVTHRLGKIEEFDRIIVMDNGSIKEDGDYETLMAKQGKFFRMWQAQFKSRRKE